LSTSVGRHGSQQGDRYAAQGLTEITEIASGPPDPASGGAADHASSFGRSDISIDGIGDPVYQAFLATGLLHPR
jgi:hypothetical protein